MRIFGILAGLISILFSPALQAQETKVFGDWTAKCDAYEECEITTSTAPNDEGHRPLTLRIARQPYETYWEISLLVFGPHPAADTIVDVAVDDALVRFESETNFAAYHHLNQYYFLNKPAQQLMDKLVPGQNVIMGFADSTGQAHASQFSLSGLAAGMLWIDEKQTRIGSERVASAPPADKDRVTTREPAPLTDELLARHAANPECDPFEDLVHGEDIWSYRIGATETLYMLPCWGGAYNFSYMIYVQNDFETRQQYFAAYSSALGWSGHAELVNPYFDEETLTLHNFAKGRGIGDCGTTGIWQWADYGFKLLEYGAKEECDEKGEPGEFPIIYRASDFDAAMFD